jgi:hypothetical protein
MSEGSEHAAILIATSYQALNRAIQANPETLITDCTVLILFAGFYVEATLNHIFDSTNKNIEAFPISQTNPHGKSYPGMKDKLTWFYNEFIEDNRATSWNKIREDRIAEKAINMFPGFSELHDFRNDISHGIVNESAKSLATAQNLRQNAKDIVGRLYAITSEKGYIVPRLVTYRDAIATLTKSQPSMSTTSSS